MVRFTAGLKAGVSRLRFGPNGDLCVGQIGDPDGNRNESGNKLFGLQKLKAKGMEIEFTEPVALDADQAAKYEVKSWTYTRTADYGGSAQNKKILAVTKVQVDASRKKVYLEVTGLTTGLTSPAMGKAAPAAFTIGRAQGEIRFRIASNRPYVLRISDARGALVAELKGEDSRVRALPAQGLKSEPYAATLNLDGKSLSRSFVHH